MKAAADVLFKKVGDELVLLDLRRGLYFGLDAVGARVWTLMTAGSQPDEIITMLTNEYDATRDEIVTGVRRFLSELREEGLVVG